MPDRTFPVIPAPHTKPARPISFVCVKFSAEFDHNLMQSPCVHDPFNQLIVVDNRSNAFFATLGQALNAGIQQAQHELIALIHEDVVLLEGWQQMFETSLAALEEIYPDWGMVGSVGWKTSDPKLVGHYSDPNTPVAWNSFEDHPHDFAKVKRLDEQLLVLRKSQGIRPDPDLPSIHFIGHDLARRLEAKKLSTFAINAPTIHKYADATGKLITNAQDSPKIQGRKSLTFKAEYDVSRLYLNRAEIGASQAKTASLTPDQQAILDAPVLMIGRGGGGTRLVSTLAQDCGLFIGNTVNASGDCIDMVPAVYRTTLRRLKFPDPWSLTQIPSDLRQAAAEMLARANWPRQWGFKLPECALLIPDLQDAFPKARFVHFARDPRATILRRTHMTGRLDNEIGRATIPAAYDHIGRARAHIISDSDLVRMAITTRHQNDKIAKDLAQVAADQVLYLTFEDTLKQPEQALGRLAAFIGAPVQSRHILDQVDASRAQTDTSTFSADDMAKAFAFLEAPL